MKIIILLFIISCCNSQYESVSNNKYRNILKYIKSSPEVKTEFKGIIKDTSNVSIKISDSLVTLGTHYFIKQILNEKLGREIRRGDPVDDSLYLEEYKSELIRCSHPTSLYVPELRKLSSSDYHYDLIMYFDIIEDSVILVSIRPVSAMSSFTYGVDFLFYFNKDVIRKAYNAAWKN